MALHKQVKKKKIYDTNWTLFPGYKDKFLIHYDNEAKCFKVTHYSRFGETAKTRFKGLAKDGIGPWRRVSWTYQRSFDNELAALAFAKEKAEARQAIGIQNAVFLLQIDP